MNWTSSSGSARQDPIPAGEAEGTVIFAPGTAVSDVAARVAELVAWKGKVFDPDKGELLNRLGPLGTHAVKAKVSPGASWLDGREAIVLDYSETSLVAHWIRDEIRGLWRPIPTSALCTGTAIGSALRPTLRPRQEGLTAVQPAAAPHRKGAETKDYLGPARGSDAKVLRARGQRRQSGRTHAHASGLGC